MNTGKHITNLHFPYIIIDRSKKAYKKVAGHKKVCTYAIKRVRTQIHCHELTLHRWQKPFRADSRVGEWGNYCMSKKSRLFLYSEYTIRIGQDFLDMRHSTVQYSSFFYDFAYNRQCKSILKWSVFFWMRWLMYFKISFVRWNLWLKSIKQIFDDNIWFLSCKHY